MILFKYKKKNVIDFIYALIKARIIQNCSITGVEESYVILGLTRNPIRKGGGEIAVTYASTSMFDFGISHCNYVVAHRMSAIT